MTKKKKQPPKNSNDGVMSFLPDIDLIIYERDSEGDVNCTRCNKLIFGIANCFSIQITPEDVTEMTFSDAKSILCNECYENKFGIKNS